ncbi:FecR family protein [Pseudomonas nicosulfuronedens]|uniref:FecR family protein n=1 Tax=Pseudomonas nicosulfuronedens TaxID=2571105 RepID=A0A5R9QRM2_9PSED|nr:FecR family protein [Pseudomonas nicosulfuronedens]MDH1012722.1 FecR family protein [Pseudomonas nicosulfuronedens]MDH1980046.1 FecR family protein [Pseudomonas nicosulfuronedens]MDH2030376.1 FecR family protein [Pseudomonas nicosulfuronedens]TLX72540.1 FecR family protein [Pseudomonas nicosulfuronedens]
MTAAEPIAPRILDEAADWLVRLQHDASEETRRACADWQRQSPQHARAWDRAERLLGYLGSLPPALAMPTLGRERTLDRRRALKQLAVLLAVAPVGLATWRTQPWQDWLADQHTAVGEQRKLPLPDGSLLTLNTDSAVDIAFTPAQRLVRLLRGEIFLDTRADGRPFLVTTREGRMQTAEARFNVRQADGATRVAVQHGRVQVSPLQGSGQWLGAGESVLLTAQSITAMPSTPNPDAWTHGMLMADRLPLQALLGELSRYRRGVLRCDPAVAQLAVSGAFPLLDSNLALSMLQATYPLRIRRVTDFWITLAAA